MFFYKNEDYLGVLILPLTEPLLLFVGVDVLGFVVVGLVVFGFVVVGLLVRGFLVLVAGDGLLVNT